MYTATPCERVLSIAASHSAYFSQPDELTRQILIAGSDMTAERYSRQGSTAQPAA
jgi:hypothetical protein